MPVVSPISTLDLKLGGRMIVKHPALAVVGAIAVAFAITIGAVAFEAAKQAFFPSIPLPQGNRIVALRNWDPGVRQPIASSRRDYTIWKRELKTVTDLSAVIVQGRNVVIGDIDGESVDIAEVTASMFRMTRVPALIGRTLVDSDERLDAPNVVVLSYDFWKNRFAGSADVVGKVIRVSGTATTIVGVMPRDYAFPVRNVLWSPMRVEAFAESSRRLGFVFGRIADGRTFDEATTQVATVGAQTAAAFPDTHKGLRAQVLTLPQTLFDLTTDQVLGLGFLNVILVLLLAVICSNVALLLFARAAARQTEIVVRTALGASRGRIITQLFAEALVLCTIGLAFGLAVSSFVLRWAWTVVEVQLKALPFWVDTTLSAETIAYAAALTVLAAIIAGILPALKVTSGGVESRLRAMSGGAGQLQFGGVWTAIIVAQIALTVMLPLMTGVSWLSRRQTRDVPRGFAAEEFLVATIGLDRNIGAVPGQDTSLAARLGRIAARHQTLIDQLRAEPGVVGVTWGHPLPLMAHNAQMVELDAGPAAARNPNWPDGYRVTSASVDPHFFDVIGAPVVRGRSLTEADADENTHAIVVNESFVKRVLAGRNPIGRRVRFLYMSFEQRATRPPGPWLEIVGVVPDLGIAPDGSDPADARYFEPRLAKQFIFLPIAIHVRGDPARFTTRLREIATAIDPALRVMTPQPLPEVLSPEIQLGSFVYRLLATLTIIAMVLSLSGVYAVMAFAVAKRTREIGVRVALGASPPQIIHAVFKRPLLQIAGGLIVGTMLAGGALSNAPLSPLMILASVAALAAVATISCAAACVVPTRRALRIQPTEALKDEG